MAKHKRPNGAGTLRRRPDGLWELTITISGVVDDDGRTKKKSFYARTQAEVLHKAEEFKKNLQSGVLDNQNYTVAEWGKEFLEHHAVYAGIAESTLDNYNYMLKLIDRYLGKKDIKALKTYDVERFLLDLKETGYGASTISKVKGLLYQMCQAAAANEMVPQNVVAYAAKMRYEKSAPKVSFTAEEVQCLMRELPQNKIGWSIRVLLMTGMRKQELLGLEPRHIAEDGSFIVVEQAVSRKKGTSYISDTKTPASRRVVPVPEKAREFAIALRNSCNGVLIWESERKPGHPVNPSFFDDRYYEALEKIEVRRISPHGCRHSYISMLRALDAPIECIMENVGQVLLSTTQRYLHVQEDVRLDATNRLNALCD